MHRALVPSARSLAWLCVLSMFACFHPAISAQIPSPPGGVQAGAALIQAPSDPAKVRGRFQLDGAERVVTEGEFYATYTLLKPHLERPDRPLRPEVILEHILLFAEADALGLSPGQAEIDQLNPVKSNSAFADQIRARWDSMGITEADFERYTRESRAIQRLKDWFANTVKVTSEEVHEQWKRDNLLYEVSYLAYPAARYEADLRKTPTDPATLQAFWAGNAAVQQRFRTPATVDAWVLVFDPSTVDEQELARRRAARKVDYAEALEHYRKNKERFDALIPSQERPKLYPPPGTVVPVADLVTPFQLLREQVERELLLGDALGQVFPDLEAASDAATWKSLAEKHGLALRVISDAPMDEVARRHGDLGPNFAATLFSANPGTTVNEVQHFAGRRFAWRLVARKESTAPAFEQVAAEVQVEWYRTESARRAMEDATKLTQEIEAAVNVAKKDELEKIDRDARERAEQEIADRKLTDDRMRESTRQRYLALAENQKRALRATASPEVFTERVKALGLKLDKHGPFAFDPQRVERDANAPFERQVADFFASSYPIRALEPGQVSQVLTDAVTNTHFIVKVDSRVEPGFDAMPGIDYYQRRLAIERQTSFNNNFQWTGFQAMRRLQWKEGP